MKSFSRSIYYTIGALVIVLAVVVGCSSSAPAAPGKEAEKAAKPADSAAKPANKVTSMTIVTPASGSTFHIMAVGISNLINKEQGIETSVEPFGGGDAALRAVGEKRAEIAVGNTLQASAAYLGQDQFKTRIPLGLIAQGQTNLRQIVIRADAGINTAADLKGKRLIGKRRALADVEQIVDAVLKSYGVPKDQVKILETAETNEAVEALKLGTADAGLIPGALGAAYFKDLTQSTKVIFLDLGPKMDAILKELPPGFSASSIPAGTYPGTDKLVNTVSAGSAAMVARTDLSDDVVYSIAKLILGKPEEMKKIHSSGADWNVTNTLDAFPIPFHAGAVKYLKEAGKWTDAAEKRQKELTK